MEAPGFLSKDVVEWRPPERCVKARTGRIHLCGLKPPCSRHGTPAAVGSSHVGSPPAPSRPPPSSDPTWLSSPPPTEEDTGPGAWLPIHSVLYPHACCFPHPLGSLRFYFGRRLWFCFVGFLKSSSVQFGPTAGKRWLSSLLSRRRQTRAHGRVRAVPCLGAIKPS